MNYKSLGSIPQPFDLLFYTFTETYASIFLFSFILFFLYRGALTFDHSVDLKKVNSKRNLIHNRISLQMRQWRTKRWSVNSTALNIMFHAKSKRTKVLALEIFSQSSPTLNLKEKNIVFLSKSTNKEAAFCWDARAFLFASEREYFTSKGQQKFIR